MNDEEKKAIEILNTFELRRKTKNYKEISLEDSQSVEILLNLIEKLQKENKELKQDRDKFKKALGKRITYCNELEKDLFENCSNYIIPIQKVKDKIEEKEWAIKSYDCDTANYKQSQAIGAWQVLQELLEGRK